MEKSVRPLVRICAISASVDLRRHLRVDQRRAERRIGMRPDGEPASAENLSAVHHDRREEVQVVAVGEDREPEPLLAERLDRRLEKFRQEERIRLERPLRQRADPLRKARQRLDRLQRKGAAPRLYRA